MTTIRPGQSRIKGSLSTSYIQNVNSDRQFHSSNSRHIHSLAPHGGVFFFVCVLVLTLTVVYTRIPILTFNQRYDFGVVEVMLTTNLATSISASGETSLNKTLVPT